MKTRSLKGIVPRISTVTVLALTAVLFVTAPAGGQIKVMPGNAADGSRVLQDKGCLSCHAINGRGATRAPDFAKPTGETNKPGLLAARMWNHSPAMFAEFEAQQREIPKLSTAEAANLYAFFYASLYFAPKGSADRGRNVFEEKRCLSCHADVLVPNLSKPLARQWTDIGDPIVLSERMWNHSNEMLAATTNRGVAWPKLSERDVVDLLLYLSRTPDSVPPETVFQVGDPGLGRAAFDRTCADCHSFGPERSKVDLLSRTSPASITDYIAGAWFHMSAM